MNAGTASQLIPGVRRLALGRNAVEAHPGVDTALRLMCGRTGSAAQRVVELSIPSGPGVSGARVEGSGCERLVGLSPRCACGPVSSDLVSSGGQGARGSGIRPLGKLGRRSHAG